MSLSIKAKHFIPPVQAANSVSEEEVIIIEFVNNGEIGPSFLFIKPEGDFLIDTIDKFQYMGTDRRAKTT